MVKTCWLINNPYKIKQITKAKGNKRKYGFWRSEDTLSISGKYLAIFNFSGFILTAWKLEDHENYCVGVHGILIFS